jgi:hypothetical protein
MAEVFMQTATVRGRRTTDPTQWFIMTMRLGEVCGGGYDILAYPPSFQSEVDPKDDLAASYTMENWQSGILSGLFYGYRKVGQEQRQQVLLEELRGQLAADGTDALAHAATALLVHLFGQDSSSVALDGWVLTIDPT